MRNRTPRRFLPHLAALGCLCLAAPVVAGPLTPPPGAPASTHKTLTEVEPRIPLNPADAPADALANFRIKSPGSYYLTGDLTGFAGPGGPAGIVIESSDVTIDLGGYTIRGGFFTGDGIRLDGAFDNITIRNGVVTGWAGRGIDLWGAGGASGGVIEDVHVSGSGLEGVRTGRGTVVRDSTASRNLGDGFRLQHNSIAIGCTAQANSGHGFMVSGSLVTQCTSSENIGMGFRGAVCVIERSNARFNDAGGIEILAASSVRDNLCTQNGEAKGGVGILVDGFGSRIEGNLSQMNAVGIATELDATQNFFSRNHSMHNALNWDLAAGNIALVVEAALAPAIVGNAGGVSPGSTNPNANYSR